MNDRDLAGAARFARLILALSAASAVAACQEAQSLDEARAYHSIPPATLELMAKQGATEMSPVLIRTFKKEAEFEIWKMGSDGRYAYIKTFPMCRWSGQLGPKTQEGDRQVPEGFYPIAPGQMNPNSHYYLSFNVGYPNAYDKAHGDTGGDIMVHGVCSSAGCFSMTDQQMDEIYAIAREAFAGGEREIQLESFPFHMTTENLAKFRLDPNMPFWRQLKEGSDYFDVTHQEPKIGVCGRHYVFNKEAVAGGRLDPTEPCPPLKAIDAQAAAEVAAKERQDDLRVAALVAKGEPAVRLVYQDGGQNPQFANKVADVSRPDALAAAPIEVPILAAVKVNGRSRGASPKDKASAIAVASSASAAKASRAYHAKPVRTASASAAARAPVAAPPAPAVAAAPPLPAPVERADTPFYRRWLSLVGDKLAPTRSVAQASSQQPTPQ